MPTKRKLDRIEEYKNSKADDGSEEDVFFDPYQIICGDSVEQVCCAKDHERRKNCSKNPWCIFGLGERKEGIWRISYLNAYQNILGPDPSLRTRTHSKEYNICNLSCHRLKPPVGLENLGATCYVNVLVQSLYHNLLVRNSIMNMELVSDPIPQQNIDVEASSHMSEVLLALQTTFAYMSDSLETTYNLRHFVELLGLDRGEQQDPIEFSKLFVSRLESLTFPSESSSASLKSGPSMTLTTLLQGSLTYRTKCCSCRTASEPRHSAFLELEVNIEGQTSLCEALASSFQDENLLGDNRYHCSRCGEKRDAIRSTALQSLPAVLSLQLLRYVYDRSSGQKKKLQNKINFPARLNLSPYSGKSDDDEYILVAVLYHKGPSAYGGHYVAETLDWAFGDWWHCDDGTVFAVQCPAEADQDGVEEIPATPTLTPVGSDRTDKGESHPKKMQVVDLCSEADGGTEEIDEKGEEVQKGARRSPSKPSTRQPAHLNRARDVYMLSYVRQKDMQAAIARMRVKVPVPAGVSESLQLSNSRNEDERRCYHLRRRRLKVRAELRKKEYEGLVPSMKQNPKFHLVRTDFLKKWIVGDSSTLRLDSPLHDDEDGDHNYVERNYDEQSMGNGNENEGKGKGCEVQQLSALCEHGVGMSPEAIESFKVVSSDTFAMLTATAEAKMDWEFNNENYRCARCFDAIVAKRRHRQGQHRFLREILAILDTAESAPPPSKGGDAPATTVEGRFWVSKSFIKSVKLAHAASAKAAASTIKKNPQEFFLPKSEKTGEQQPASSKIVFQVDPTSERVNSSLQCPQHCDENVLASSPPTYRTAMLLSHAGWNKLRGLFPHAIAFPESAAACPICAIRDGDEQMSLRRAKDVRAQDVKQKYMLQLSKARSINVNLPKTGTTCYLVDGVWLAYWREWLGDVNLARPPPLTNYRLRCDHGSLLVCQSFLLATLFSSSSLSSDSQVDGSEEERGSTNGEAGLLAVKSLEEMGYDAETFTLQSESHQSCFLDTFPALEILTQQQWFDLLARFNCSSEDEEKEDQVVDLQEDLFNISDREVFEVCLAGTGDNDSRWQPARCEDCCRLIEIAQEKAKRCYKDAEIIIKLLGHERDLPIYTSTSTTATASISKRTRASRGATIYTSTSTTATASISKRTRASRGATRRATTYKVRMNSSDRISLLKLRLFEIVTAKDLPPSRQRLYNSKGEEFKSDSSTLLDCGVQAGETLLLVPVEAQTGTNGDDVIDVDGWNESVLAALEDHDCKSRASSKRDPERGFGGTFLLSSSSSSSSQPQQQQQQQPLQVEVVNIS